MDRLTVSVAGTQAMRARINAMSDSVGGAVMRPVVQSAALQVRDLAAALAPKRTGRGRQGIITDLMKIGKGYCYYWVRLQPDAYYMFFQEIGLGTGASRPVQEKTRRRRVNFIQSMAIRQRLREQGVLPAEIMAARYLGRQGNQFGLSRRELKRQAILARGGRLQGQRHPNMAAHPWLRPAVRFTRTGLRQYMLEALAANIRRWDAR